MNYLYRLLILSLFLMLTACATMYLEGLEKVGIPKRDVMVYRVEKARDTQEETKEQSGFYKYDQYQQREATIFDDLFRVHDQFKKIFDAFQGNLVFRNRTGRQEMSHVFSWDSVAHYGHHLFDNLFDLCHYRNFF